MIAIENFSIGFKEKIILNKVNLLLKKNTCYCLLGKNGSGKSSLLKAITQDIEYKGNILLNNKNISQNNSKNLAKKIGFLTQNFTMEFDFKAFEIVEMGAYYLSLSFEQQNKLIKKTMQETNSWQLSTQNYNALSGGQKQRVNLARVLVQVSQEKNPVLLLDEPISAQDIKNQHLILKLVKEKAKQGFLVIMVLHDLNHAIAYSDKTIILHKSLIYKKGFTKDVIDKKTIFDVWDYEICEKMGFY